jgi:hypothetical protein
MRINMEIFLLNGPAADATDAPLPEGLLYNPVMKMMMKVSFFCFYILMKQRWNEIDRRKPKYSEKNLSQ